MPFGSFAFETLEDTQSYILSYPPAASLEWYVVGMDPQHVLAANNWNGVILQSHDRGHTWVPY